MKYQFYLPDPGLSKSQITQKPKTIDEICCDLNTLCKISNINLSFTVETKDNPLDNSKNSIYFLQSKSVNNVQRERQKLADLGIKMDSKNYFSLIVNQDFSVTTFNWSSFDKPGDITIVIYSLNEFEAQFNKIYDEAINKEIYSCNIL